MRTIDKIIHYGLLFLIIFPPLTVCFKQLWYYTTAAAIVALMLVGLWLLRCVLDGEFKFIKTPLNIPAFALLAVIIFQLIPLPPALLNIISPESTKVYEMVDEEGFKTVSKILKNNEQIPNTFFEYLNEKENYASHDVSKNVQELENDDDVLSYKPSPSKKWRTIVLYKHVGIEELLKFLIYISVYFLVVNTVNSRRQINQMVMTIIITGTCLAFLGLIQYLSNTDKILWFHELHLGYRGPKHARFFSTFPNGDRFANFMLMIIPLTFGLIISERFYSHKKHKPGPGSAKRTSSAVDKSKLLNKMVFFIFSGVVMTASLFFARSTGAALSIIIAFIVLGGMMLCVNRLRKGSWIVLPVLFGALGVLLWVGIQPVIDEISTTLEIERLGFDARLAIWLDGLNGVKDFPTFGTGLGVFPHIFPKYFSELSQIAFPRTIFINYAHNEYLQLLCEAGIVGLAIFLWGGYRFIKDIAFYHILGFTNGINHVKSTNNIFTRFKKLFNKKDSSSKTNADNSHLKGHEDPFVIGISIGGFIAILGMSLHNFVDFNLHVDPNAYLFVILLGITTVVVHNEDI